MMAGDGDCFSRSSAGPGGEGVDKVSFDAGFDAGDIDLGVALSPGPCMAFVASRAFPVKVSSTLPVAPRIVCVKCS